MATAAGMIASLYPIALLVSAGVFAIALFSTGIASVASLTAAILFPVVLVVLKALGVFDASLRSCSGSPFRWSS